jgi:hypothetical protein
MENFRQIVANNSTTHKGSEYTAVGGLSNGRPVIAWYDNANQRLVFSYGIGTPSGTAHNTNTGTANTSIVTTTTAQWQSNAVVVDTYRGAHVDMAIDGGDNVHLAYYDTGNGGLYYAYIPYDPATNGPNRAGVQTARVDTYLAVGTKLMINVRKEGSNYVPYITYYHGSFAETKHPVRVAWRKDFSNPGIVPQGTNLDDSFTGAWEVMTVPVKEAPMLNEFVCNGVPNPDSAMGNWTDPDFDGGAAGVPALKRGNIDLRRSVVVGYLTDSYYEGAMLKGDVTQ